MATVLTLGFGYRRKGDVIRPITNIIGEVPAEVTVTDDLIAELDPEEPLLVEVLTLPEPKP